MNKLNHFIQNPKLIEDHEIREDFEELDDMTIDDIREDGPYDEYEYEEGEDLY